MDSHEAYQTTQVTQVSTFLTLRLLLLPWSGLSGTGIPP